MELNDEALNRFLRPFIPISNDQFIQKVSKQTLRSRLAKFLKEESIDEDPVLAFEDLESILFTPKFISGFLVSYDHFTDVLRVEYIPTTGHIERALEVFEDNIDLELMNNINELSPVAFEFFIVELLSGVDWVKNVRVTQHKKDGGLDFIGEYILPDTLSTMIMIGEAKHWQKPVGVKQIREFIGVLASYEKSGPKIGIYISTNGFTESARKVMMNSPHRIHGYQRENLIDMMKKYNIGTQTINIEGRVVDEQFWKDLED
jgi:restriction endonuclease Mrr